MVDLLHSHSSTWGDMSHQAENLQNLGTIVVAQKSGRGGGQQVRASDA